MRTISSLPLLRSALWLGLFALVSGCSEPSHRAGRANDLEARVAALESALAQAGPASIPPRLGNIMGMMQVRHSKLWLAGEQANWPLASYQLHELEEDFEDVEKYHPTHGSAGLPLGQMAAQLPKPALTALKQAIDSADHARFAAGFDTLTASCNACHAAAGVAFNVIQRPASHVLSNQDFARRPSASFTGLQAARGESASQRALPK